MSRRPTPRQPRWYTFDMLAHPKWERRTRGWYIIGALRGDPQWQGWEFADQGGTGALHKLELRCPGHPYGDPTHCRVTVRSHWALEQMERNTASVTAGCLDRARADQETEERADQQPQQQPAPVVHLAQQRALGAITTVGHTYDVIAYYPAMMPRSFRTGWGDEPQRVPAQWLCVLADHTTTVFCDWCRACFVRPDPQHAATCKQRNRSGGGATGDKPAFVIEFALRAGVGR